MQRAGLGAKSLTSSRRSALLTAFHRSGERRFSGSVVDSSRLGEKFVVEILIDGYPAKVIRSDAAVDKFIKGHIGDGCYGFSCVLCEAAIRDGAVVEARLANLGTALGAPITLAKSSKEEEQIAIRGTVRWIGGLRFSGWISGSQETAIANVLVDGTLVTRVRASTWTSTWEGRKPMRVPFVLSIFICRTLRRRQRPSTL